MRSALVGRMAMFALPVAIAAAIAAALLAARAPPERARDGERPHAVRVLEIAPMDVTPRAVGFGEVQPATTWQGVAEVRGRVVERHPRLEAGALLAAGETLLRIDPSSYRLAVARIEADMRVTEASIAESAASEENTRRSLAIEEASLEASEAELERLESLFASGSVSRSQVDGQRRATLAQRQSVQQQRNALNVLPARRAALEAQLLRQRAELDTARLDVEHTRLTLPMDARIAEANAVANQYVREGELLVAADGIERAEVAAQIPLGHVRGLVALPPGAVFDPTDPGLLGRIGLSARVEPAGLSVQWDATVDRFAAEVDPKTRTIGIIVAVDEPYRRARPGERPPLVRGMFARVVVYGATLPGAIAVPAGSVRDGAVWVADAQDRLRRRPVEVALAQPGFTVLASGLAAGDRLVLSDLAPAIDGMLLAPQPDAGAAQALRDAAARPASPAR